MRRSVIFGCVLCVAGAVAAVLLRGRPGEGARPPPGSTLGAPDAAPGRAAPSTEPDPREADATPMARLSRPADGPPLPGSALASLEAALRALPPAPATPAAAFLRAREAAARDLARALDLLAAPAVPLAAGRLVGRVVDEHGAPLEGALVSVRPSDGGHPDAPLPEADGAAPGPLLRREVARAAWHGAPFDEARADAQGCFSLTTTSLGRHSVSASAPGRGSDWVNGFPAPEGRAPEPLEITLTAQVRVRVQVERGASPTFDEMYVRVEGGPDARGREAGWADRAEATAQDRAAGAGGAGADAVETHVFMAPPGRWVATASLHTATGAYSAKSAALDLLPGEATQDVPLRLEALPVLTTRVVIPAGEPIRPQVRVFAIPGEVGPEGPSKWQLNDGRQWIELVDEDFERYFPEAPDDRDPDVVGAAPGELVETIRKTIDEPGPYTVYAARVHNFDSPGALSEPVRVEVGPAGAEARLRLPPIAEPDLLALSFESPEGAPYTGASLESDRRWGYDNEGTTVVDLSGLDPERDVRLLVNDYRLGKLLVAVPRPFPAALRVSFAPPARLLVTVEDEHGRPLDPGTFALTLEAEEAPYPPVQEDFRSFGDETRLEVRSEKDGRGLLLCPVQPGRYDAVARVALPCGCRSPHLRRPIARWPLEVAPGEHEVTLRLPAPAALRVRAPRGGRLQSRPRDTHPRRDEIATRIAPDEVVTLDGLMPGEQILTFTPNLWRADESPVYALRVTAPREGILEIGPPGADAAALADAHEGAGPLGTPSAPAPGAAQALRERVADAPPRPAPLRGRRSQASTRSNVAEAGESADTPSPAPPGGPAPVEGTSAEGTATDGGAAPVTRTAEEIAAEAAALRLIDEAALHIATTRPEPAFSGEGRIWGRVVDDLRAPLPGVTVTAVLLSRTLTAREEALDEEWRDLGLRPDLAAALRAAQWLVDLERCFADGVSDGGGAYAISGLAPGLYEVSAGERADMRCQGPRAFRLDAYSDDSWYTRTDGRKDIVLDRSSERALARAAHDPSPEADPDPPPEANPALGAPAASPAPATEVSPANEIATTHPAPAAPARRPGVTLLVRVAAEPPPSEEDAVYLAIEPRPLPDDPPESNLYELRRSGSLRGPGDGRIEDVRPGPALLLVDRDIGPHGERTHFFALALTVPEGGGALDVALPALAPLTVEIGRGRRGRLRAWLLDGPEPFEVVLDPRGFEGTLSLPHVPPGRWLFTLEPDPPEDAALPTSGRGALPHLERRVTLPGTSLVRFEPP